MIDIVEITNDIRFYDTQAAKAGNVLDIQLGDLEYLPDFGIDLEYFLDESFQFQNEAFRAYIRQRLAENGIEISGVIEQIDALSDKYTYILSGNEGKTSQIVR